MAKKGTTKADKEAKKARMAEKNAKIANKSERGAKKLAKKLGDEEEDDVPIEDMLAAFAKEQEEFLAVDIVNCEPPSRRINSVMVPNPIQGKHELILFGGEIQENNLAKFYNDTFTYSLDTDQWKKISSPNSPLPRSGHAMCAHPSGIIMMFGGEFSSPKQTTFYHYGDTWIFDPAVKEWTKIENRKSPTARSGHRMTVWKNYIILHGGFKDLSKMTEYKDDLWVFDITSYKWEQIEFPANHPVPDARSGHSLVPSPEGAVIWGGYSKVKAGKGNYKGKVHVDTWLLKMKSDLKAIRWERRKKNNFAPSSRVGCSMAYHKGRGILFGGVYDTNETEETLDSIFYNTLHAYQIELNKWFPLTLRKKRKQPQQVAAPSRKAREADLEETLAAILKDKLQVDDEETPEENGVVSDEEEEEVILKEYPTMNQYPHPRFNATTTVVDDTFFIFGGVWEKGDKEFNINSMYSIDLSKLDGVKVYWEDLKELEAADQDSEDEYDDDDDDEDDDEERPEDKQLIAEEEEESEEEESEDEEEEADPDPRPWLPHPKAFEALRDFYERTSADFVDWALKIEKDARGKDLKRNAFDLAEARWWERREVLRIAEDHLEEIGGVADIIEREAAKPGKTNRR